MYTKGPWVVNEAAGRWWVDAVNGNQITPSCNYENENDRDDARLIAAAPELLEALRVMLKGDELGEFECQQTGFPRLTDRRNMARAAIAKAEASRWGTPRPGFQAPR